MALLFGGPGLVIGLLLGAVLRRWRRIAVATGLVLAGYLAFLWFSAPTTHQGCGSDCYEWNGRYGEWSLLAYFVAINVLGLVAGAALGSMLRRARSRRPA